MKIEKKNPRKNLIFCTKLCESLSSQSKAVQTAKNWSLNFRDEFQCKLFHANTSGSNYSSIQIFSKTFQCNSAAYFSECKYA